VNLRVTPKLRLAALALTAFALSGASSCLADGAYRLVPEDVIAIQVLYHPELSVPEATVRPDGMVNYPVAGDVQAAGASLVELSETIAEALRQELRDPKVSVRLVRRYVMPVYVLGSVRMPGAVHVTGPVTVAEAMALAGGLAETAAPRMGTLVRADGSQAPVDIMASLSGQTGLVLQPGDTLVVSAQFLVSVVGEVTASGRYPAEQGDRVADAIAAAGGLVETADRSAARLIRADGTSLPVDISAIITDAGAEHNHLLTPGDLIVVPTLERRVTVVGAVKLPGKYDFDDGDRVSDALAQARGALDEARLTDAVLVRRDGSAKPVDLQAITQHADQAGDVALVDGDTLIVPRWADQIAVMGMVSRPGTQPLEDGMTAMGAIAGAGGWPADGAAPARTVLWRQGEAEPEIIAINALALMRGDADVHDIPLQPGDIIYVPGSRGMDSGEFSRVLLGIASVLRLVY